MKFAVAKPRNLKASELEQGRYADDSNRHNPSQKDRFGTHSLSSLRISVVEFAIRQKSDSQVNRVETTRWEA